MLNIGPGEMMLLGLLFLLLFGPQKLPELGRALGQGIAAFREHSRAVSAEFTRQLEDETSRSQGVHEWRHQDEPETPNPPPADGTQPMKATESAT